MSYVWFQSVLEALGKRLNYESISNIYGNSFAKKAGEIVQQAYPLSKQHKGAGLMGMIGMTDMKTIESTGSKEHKMNELGKALGGGDTSWFAEFLT